MYSHHLFSYAELDCSISMSIDLDSWLRALSHAKHQRNFVFSAYLGQYEGPGLSVCSIFFY